MERVICTLITTNSGYIKKIKQNNKLFVRKYTYNTFFRLFINEVACMKKFRDDNIISLINYGIENNSYMNYYLTMPFYKMDLESFFRKHISPEIIDYIVGEIFKGLSHIHSYNMIHGDIKPSNILINYDSSMTKENISIKIIDFEFCGYTSSTYDKYTINYRPIEGFLENEYYLSSDIWAMGCLVYQIINNKSLFPKDNNADKIFNKIPIRYKNIYFRESVDNYRIPIQLSNERYKIKFTKLIYDTIIINHEYRLSCMEILDKYYSVSYMPNISYIPTPRFVNTYRDKLTVKLNKIINKFKNEIYDVYEIHNLYTYRLKAKTLWDKYNKYLSIITVFDLIDNMGSATALKLYNILNFDYYDYDNSILLYDILHDINFNIYPTTIMTVILNDKRTSFENMTLEDIYIMLKIVYHFISSHNIICNKTEKNIINLYNNIESHFKNE